MPTPTDEAVFETHLSLGGRRQGKVREIYDLPPDAHGPRVLLVASDRVSAFDVVMPTAIPGKGRLLTAIAAGWFEMLRTQSIVRDHLIATDVRMIEGLDEQMLRALRGRSMICRAAQVIPIECVARGYLAGSGWSEYQANGSVCGVALPAGLRQSERLPEPIFTPATKAATGHDENVSIARAGALVGDQLMDRLRRITLQIYTAAAAHALSRGVILADTKFEFGFALGADGLPTTELLLIDEVLTPDSSRYWPSDGYEAGRDQPSFDKQYLRNWLNALVRDGAWNKSPPGPAVPPEIVAGTLARYREAYDRLFGSA